MKVSNTSERLKQWLHEHNARQVDILNLAKPYIEKYNIKLNKNDMSQYISGKVEPGQKKLFILAKALNVSESWLMGFDVPPNPNISEIIKNAAESLYDNDPRIIDKLCEQVIDILDPNDLQSFENVANILPLPTLKRIPLLGNIACGDPILAIETSEDSVTIPETLHADFALCCKGDSMINARILDGDIVYIQRQDDVDNGEIAAVIIDDEATLKRVYKDDRHEQLTLMPENPAYPPLVYRGEELNNIRIIGKVVGFFSSQIK